MSKWYEYGKEQYDWRQENLARLIRHTFIFSWLALFLSFALCCASVFCIYYFSLDKNLYVYALGYFGGMLGLAFKTSTKNMDFQLRVHEELVDFEKRYKDEITNALSNQSD